MSNNRIFGYVFGAVYLLVGLAGFAVTGGLGYAATDGNNLIIFGVNPLHNLVHLGVGTLLLLGAVAGDSVARSFHLVVGVTLVVVAVLGLGLVGINHGEYNIIAVNHADNALHLVLGVATLAIAAARWPVPSGARERRVARSALRQGSTATSSRT